MSTELHMSMRAPVCGVQYFWFRHGFLLSEGDSAAICALTVRLLADKKVEVQELAATTLSGLLKVTPALCFPYCPPLQHVLVAAVDVCSALQACSLPSRSDR